MARGLPLAATTPEPQIRGLLFPSDAPPGSCIFSRSASIALQGQASPPKPWGQHYHITSTSGPPSPDQDGVFLTLFWHACH